MVRAGTQTDLLRELADLCSPGTLLTDPAARRVYSRDASHLTDGSPLAVALPASADEVAAIVSFCAERGLAITPRGTGTGLSGGAVPSEGSLVLGLGRLLACDRVDPGRGSVRVEAGVLNDEVSRRAAGHGLHFAPDPSSQSASTIGGNIANNAGGPHCLRHGVTAQHLRRLEWVDGRGRRATTGRGLPAERGIDLGALLCGSEGTLGVVTAADLRLVPAPEAAATLAAFFPELDAATRAVVELLGAGLVPVAVEMVDRAMLEAIEAAFGFGFPTDVEAAMILEFAGNESEAVDDAGRAEHLLRRAGAREVSVAADDGERAELWRCRKKAFGAVGRLAPGYVTMDVVVPLGRLPRLVREIQEIRRRHGVEISTAFHAGDGNLHPGVHYDDRDPELERRAHVAADEIMQAALVHGGSVSGEHGVGLEKLHAAPWQLDPTALELMQAIRRRFDPGGLLNPGRALPPGTGPDEPIAPVSAPEGLHFAWDSLTVTAAASASVLDLQRLALERGLWLPVGLPAPGLTVGDWVDHLLLRPAPLAAASIRDVLLESWSELPDGRLLHAGAPVVKNVVGYDLPRLLCGSGGLLGRNLGATFQLKTAPTHLWIARAEMPGSFGQTGQAGLAALAGALRAVDAARGGATLVVDGDAGSGRLLVVVPGRDRPWGLQTTARHLAAVAGRGGIELSGAIEEMDDAARFARRLPEWCTAAGGWTVLAALEGAAVLPDRLPARWIWLAQPGLLWTPDELEAPPRWHADRCLQQGRPTPLPRPDQGVPLDLLRALAGCFDTTGRRAQPAWLLEAPHG